MALRILLERFAAQVYVSAMQSNEVTYEVQSFPSKEGLKQRPEEARFGVYHLCILLKDSAQTV